MSYLLQKNSSNNGDGETGFIRQGGVYEIENADGLTEVYNPINNLVIWKRAKHLELAAAVSKLLEQNRSLRRTPIQLEEHVSPGTVSTYLCEQFKCYQGVDAVIEDITELVDMFCCLFDVEKTGLRLTMLDRAMCPKFHVDRVPCRLVTTYQGVATEWLHHMDVDRSKLGKGGHGLPDRTSGIYRSEADINRLEVFEVALLKGELWEGNEGAGIVHRSPEVISGEQRLLLTLDMVG